MAFIETRTFKLIESIDFINQGFLDFTLWTERGMLKINELIPPYNAKLTSDITDSLLNKIGNLL